MKVKNGIKYEKNGWIYLSIKGTPYERGYAHGSLVVNELKEIFKMLEYTFYEDLGYTYAMITEITAELYGAKIEQNYPEFYEEMRGITAGAKAAGFKSLTFEQILTWNCNTSIGYFLGKLPALVKENAKLNAKYGELFKEGAPSKHGEGGGGGGHTDKCTGFMAVGSYTHDGKIVTGHSTFDNFIQGQHFNYILDIKPTKGNRMLMQATAGYISSQTDYYVTSNGFVCTETTIGGFNAFTLKDPICCRIRQAMQYGNSLDEIAECLKTNNGGDYANAWLIGDTNTNTIMRIELGMDYVNIEKKTDGYFIGFNAPYDPRIRNLECSSTGFDDIRRHQGARRVRLEQLMEQHKGKLNVEIGQDIMGDHYDVYLNKINPCSRTCCSHYELDERAFMSDPARPKPYQPRGAVDGIVGDTALTKKMAFSARWGSSCGMPFDVKEFCKKNIIWKDQGPYLHDRPHQPWTEFTIHRGESHHNKTKKKAEKVLKMKRTKKPKLKL